MLLTATDTAGRSVTELVAVTVKLVKKPVHHGALRASAFAPLSASSAAMRTPFA